MLFIVPLTFDEGIPVLKNGETTRKKISGSVR